MLTLRTVLVRRAAALAALLGAAPAAARAQQTQTFQLCGVDAPFCASLSVTRLAARSIQVDVRNTGVASNQTSFLSGFGLFLTSNPTNIVGTLASATFFNAVAGGGTQSVNLLVGGFAENGAPNGMNGAGTRDLFAATKFGNNGFRPCGFGDTSTGNTRYETCAGESARFVFALSGDVSAQTFLDPAQFGVGLRVQGIGANGLSDKCFSAGDANCRVTLAPAAAASVVPEPSTYALLAGGLAGLAGLARRRRNG